MRFSCLSFVMPRDNNHTSRILHPLIISWSRRGCDSLSMSNCSSPLCHSNSDSDFSLIVSLHCHWRRFSYWILCVFFISFNYKYISIFISGETTHKINMYACFSGFVLDNLYYNRFFMETKTNQLIYLKLESSSPNYSVLYH